MLSFISKCDISDIEKELFDSNGLLNILPSSYYASIEFNKLQFFCYTHSIYCLPTTELIDWLKPHVVPDKTIEIGAGVGAVGRALGIPITDSRYFEHREIKQYYSLMGQPVTKYPSDVIKADAIAAVQGFKPDVVIGCWITHKYNPNEHWREGNKWGVDEGLMLKKIKRYIMVGNEYVHGLKPIGDLPHEVFSFPWLWSRSEFQNLNRIYVWHHGE